MWTEVFGIFQKYMGTGLTAVLFLAAVLYLFLTEKRKERRLLFVYLPSAVLLLYFNPLFASLFVRIVGSEIYFRMCWLLPVVLVLGYAIVQIAENHLQGRKRTCFLVLAALIVMLSGKLVYTNPLFSQAENPYHVPEAVVKICDAIKADGREVMAVFPKELLLYVRQYSPYVCMPYGREGFDGDNNDFFIAMERDVIDLEELAPFVQQKGCHYVILDAKKEIPGNPQDFSLELFLETEGYAVYRNTAISLEY